jgi:hypothetical protein
MLGDGLTESRRLANEGVTVLLGEMRYAAILLAPSLQKKRYLLLIFDALKRYKKGLPVSRAQ